MEKPLDLRSYSGHLRKEATREKTVSSSRLDGVFLISVINFQYILTYLFLILVSDNKKYNDRDKYYRLDRKNKA